MIIWSDLALLQAPADHAGRGAVRDTHKTALMCLRIICRMEREKCAAGNAHTDLLHYEDGHCFFFTA